MRNQVYAVIERCFTFDPASRPSFIKLAAVFNELCASEAVKGDAPPQDGVGYFNSQVSSAPRGGLQAQESVLDRQATVGGLQTTRLSLWQDALDGFKDQGRLGTFSPGDRQVRQINPHALRDTARLDAAPR